MRKVQGTLGHVTAEDGGINTHGLWKAKHNIIPNDKENNPIALKDNKGNMITCPEGIKQMCIKEMVERLRHRKMHPDLLEMQHVKEKLCKERLDMAKHMKSKHWTLDELIKVLGSLKMESLGTLKD